MASLAVAGDECPEDEVSNEGTWNDLAQDLNFNGIEAMDEEAVDLADPLCLSQVNAEGVPWPNADYYIGYMSFGCLYPVAEYDVDGDGLVTAEIFTDSELLFSLGHYLQYRSRWRRN